MEKEKYYFCEYLRVIYLLMILFKDILIKNTNVVIYYLKPNNFSVFAENSNRLVWRFITNHIEIKQSPHDLAEIDNSLNGSVCKKAYVDAANEIIGKIDKQILQPGTSMLNFLNKKLNVQKNNIRFYIRNGIAFDIVNDLLLVEVADFLSRNTQSTLYGANLILFIDRKNYWTRFVFEYASKKGVSFLSIDKFILKKNNAVQFAFSLARLFAECSASFLFQKKHKPQKATNKIGIPYYYHKNFTEFFNKKNYYLYWYPESEIDPSRIMIYSNIKMDIPLEEKKKIENLGFNMLSCSGFLRRRENFYIPKYRCSFRIIELTFEYIAQSVNLLLHVCTRSAFEQWKILAFLFVRLPYWEDFFSSNNIKVKFRFHDLFSWRDIAANLAGAITISYHYSNQTLNTFTALHHDICDVYFIWGKEYEKLYFNENSGVKNVVHSGYIFDYRFNMLDKKAVLLRSKFIRRGVNFIIAMLDENMKFPGRENVLSLYREIMNLSLNDPGIGLIIKPKYNNTRSILESSEKTSELLLLLEKEERIEILDSYKFPVEVGKASDLVIGVYADSTAAFECALAGVPAIVCECYHGEIKSSISKRYRNKVLFYDLKSVIDSIQIYKLKRHSCNGFANWTDILGEKDSFRDGKANRRIGLYIKALLLGIDLGLKKDEVIKKANKVYMDKFGYNKIYSLSNSW